MRRVLREVFTKFLRYLCLWVILSFKKLFLKNIIVIPCNMSWNWKSCLVDWELGRLKWSCASERRSWLWQFLLFYFFKVLFKEFFMLLFELAVQNVKLRSDVIHLVKNIGFVFSQLLFPFRSQRGLCSFWRSNETIWCWSFVFPLNNCSVDFSSS